MSWQLLIGLSVLLYSINSLLHRTLLKGEDSDAYAQAVVFTGLVGVFSLIILKFMGGFKSVLSWNLIPSFLCLSFLSAMGMVFMFKGFKLVGASEHSILLTSSRIWAILGAVLFLHESPTVTKLIGALLILLGVVITEWRKEKLVFNKGAVYVLLAAFFFAVSETLSFFVVRNFDVLSFMVYASFMVSSILLILRPKTVKKIDFYFKPKNGINILVTSLNDGLANIFGFLAYQVGRNALQIGPLGATQTPLTVLLAIILLKERERMNQRIIGSLAAVLGTVLLLK